ncbi:hypothetical protein RHGRI_000774 [Rhododendron griersonianum]|uniref:Uncharacterized protein n=1 Tax=Rhododendron griersonianum TaxID=479676 RepID=A0AAV6LIA0_9ERIC|nr:hypothetical protein RHGRI_000774 [Rhododendron griersonianum]
MMRLPVDKMVMVPIHWCSSRRNLFKMVTANRFWSQILGVAFLNKRWLHRFMDECFWSSRWSS